MKITKLGLIIVIGLFMVFGGTDSRAQKLERPLRAVIPPPQEEEKATPGAEEKEEKTSPQEAVPAQKETKEETPLKVKTPRELEEEKKQRAEFLKEARVAVEKLEHLRITVQFGGEVEEFKKRLLEAGFALHRAKTKAQGPLAQASSLAQLEVSADNFIRAKDAWEQANIKRDEAQQNYKQAETAFPENQRRYYRERRETALGGVYDLDAPWVKAYNDYKERGDIAKRESEQLLLARESYLNAAYSSMEAAKEALKEEGK
jgi:hypothetical protein